MRTLTGAGGLVPEATTYGGAVTCLLAPRGDGRVDDVVLGSDNLNHTSPTDNTSAQSSEE